MEECLVARKPEAPIWHQEQLRLAVEAACVAIYQLLGVKRFLREAGDQESADVSPAAKPQLA